MPTPRYRENSTSPYNVLRTLSNDVVRQNSTSYFNPPTQKYFHTPYNVSCQVPGRTKSIFDWVTPNYRKVIKSGRIVNNSLYVNETTEIDPVVNIDYTRTTNYKMLDVANGYAVGIFPYQINNRQGQLQVKNLTTGSGLDYLSLDAEIDREILQQKAITKSWANIKENDMLALATAKETSKTARDLHGLAKKVIKTVKFIKHPKIPKNFLSWKHAKKFYQESEDLYMQARYNLRPLYYDILGTMKIATEDSYTKRNWRNNLNRYSIRANEYEIVSDSDVTAYSSSYLPGVNLRLTRNTSREVEVRAGVLCQAGEWSVWDKAGIYLIPETLWELTPYSFILDWFGNFGDVISSWSPNPGVKTLTSWVTTTEVVTQQMSVSMVGVTDSAPHSSSVGQIWDTVTDCSLPGSLTAFKTVKSVTRQPNPGRPYSPHLDVNLDLNKIIDLAVIGKNLGSLIRQTKKNVVPPKRSIITLNWRSNQTA